MPNDFCTVCPDLCTGNTLLPALDTNVTCFTFETKESQISDILILPPGATGPTDWETPADWTAVIDNTDVLNANVKHLVVEGGLPAPEKTQTELPKLTLGVTSRRYTITAAIKNLSDLNYEFLRALQCGDSGFTFWYATIHRLFGGQDGVEPSLVDVDFIYGEGREDIEQANLIIEFVACGDPDRTASPFA